MGDANGCATFWQAFRRGCDTVRGMTKLSLALLVLLAACREPAAPERPVAPKIRAGGCTVFYKYWMDRADHSGGSLLLSYTYTDTNDCPDSVWVAWDEDAGK